MTPYPFVDAHIHLWDLERLRYPWLTPPFDDAGPNGSVEPIARDFGPADYRAALARWRPVAAVHVDAGADARDALAETEWLEALADAGGVPSAIVAFAALDAPDLDVSLARQAAHPRVRGIRQIVNWHPDPRRSYTLRDLTNDERWAAGYARLGAHGLSFDLQCYPAQMPAMARLVERHPEVAVAINHLGMPVLTDPEGIDDWRRGMAALARLPHVAVKLSGLGFVERNWAPERMLPLLRETLDRFGAARCMIASDVPTDLLFAPVDRYLETYEAALDGCSDDERRDAWGRTANRHYRLGLDI